MTGSRDKLAASFLSRPSLPPVLSLGQLAQLAQRFYLGPQNETARPQDPSDFPAGPPPSPALKRQLLAPPTPCQSDPIVLRHLESSANCQPQKARSASLERSRLRLSYKHQFLKGW